MLLLIITTILLIIGIIWFKNVHREYELFPFLLAIISGTALSFMLIFIPIQRQAVNAGIAEFEAAKASFERSRSSKENIERFSAIKEVIESNQWLASQKYYNSTVWDLWIPDTIEELTPIE